MDQKVPRNVCLNNWELLSHVSVPQSLNGATIDHREREPGVRMNYYAELKHSTVTESRLIPVGFIWK